MNRIASLFASSTLALAGTLSAGAALAQAWPAKPVRVIVPYVPGGSGDIMARIFAVRMSEAWGQSVVVENRPGATGMIGANVVAKAAPDGYSLLLGYVSEVAINPGLFPKMTYDPAKELTPIAMAGVLPLIFVANPSLPVRSVRDLLALAKARPGQITYGSAGNGTPAHLGTEYLKRTAGVDMVHVPYKGAAEVVSAIIGGHVMVFFSGIPPAIPHVKSGKLRALAVSTATRVPSIPDVPTVAESGSPGFDVGAWFGYFAPTGTPREVINRVSSTVATILRNPEIVRQFEPLGIVIAEMGPEKFAPFIESEMRKYAKLIKESGARAD